jgi:hypothetical protein
MQPYFFPYLGYFALAAQADVWVVYDLPQHMSQGWVHRNRVLHPLSGWQYIIVPCKKHPSSAPINTLQIAHDRAWQARILGQISHYRKHAPHYGQTLDLLCECLDAQDQTLAKLNERIFRLVCARLGIICQIHVASEISLPSEVGKSPEETAIAKCRALGATEYLNPAGGAALYCADHFTQSGLTLRIQSYTNMVYDCTPYQFEPALSIIDTFMWNSTDSIRHHLDITGHANQSATSGKAGGLKL